MITRKAFSNRLLAAVAAGSLMNFELVAAPENGNGNNNNNNRCNGHGQADQCHGNGVKADRCVAHQGLPNSDVCGPAQDTCKQADTCTGYPKDVE